MSLQTINSEAELNAGLESCEGPAIIAFFGDFSEASKKAQPTFEACCEKHEDKVAFSIDVGTVKGIHKGYDVSSVPTVIIVDKGEVKQRIVGPQSQDFYARALLNLGVSRSKRESGGVSHRVVVYVSDSCSWCTKVKNYLRRRGVRYSEINVSRDPNAARDLQNRTGQTGVPQLDIDGQYIVGFDKPRIDQLLDLSPEANN